MCGIVGILSNEGYLKADDRKNFFVQSLYTDALRGWDSTGYFLVPERENDDLIIMKRAYQAVDFLDLGSVQRHLRNFGAYRAAIGHNRAATIGKVSHRTAHPFNHGDITLVHNGTLTTTLGLPDQNLFTVDSEVIAHSFNKESPEDIIPELQGAFALIWHNSKDGTISVVRNDERPLSFATIDNNKTVLLASEYKMLDWLASRNKMLCKNIFTVPKGKIFTFNKDNPQEYTTKDVKLYQKKFYEKPYSGNNNNRNRKGSHVFSSPTNLLTKLGLKMGETIDIDPIEFVCYNKSIQNPKWGYLYGIKDGTKYKNELRISQLKESDWGWAAPDSVLNVPSTLLSATIDNACLGADGKIIVYLSKPEMSNTPFRDQEEEEEEDKSSSKEIAEILVTGPTGEVLNKAQWDKITNKGCVVCGGNVNFEDAESTGWTGDGQPMCHLCIVDGGWEQYLQKAPNSKGRLKA